MNIKMIIIGLVVLVAVGGGAFVVTSNKNDDKASTAESSGQSTKTPKSINELLSQNKNIKCTFNTTDENGNKSSGTSYIAGQRMRGSFSIQTTGQAEQKTNVLRDDSSQYVWNEGSKTGFKTSNSSVAASSESQDTQSQQSVDQDKEYDFDCSDWSVDESMFKAPNDVEFTDFSAQVQQSQEAQQNISGACAQITDATARAACENAL